MAPGLKVAQLKLVGENYALLVWIILMALLVLPAPGIPALR